MIVDRGERPVDSSDPRPSGGTVVWLFGRGLSIESGLTWTEPEEWKTQFPRLDRIEHIKQALRTEMARVDSVPIREFLMFLNQHTSPEWRHLFLTTNWDYLWQRELNALAHGPGAPRWLHSGAGSHVHHVNGTVEEGTQHRSCFMLQDDTGAERTATTEANYAFGYLSWERTFVVVGMSFECNTDRFLLRQLNKVQDWSLLATAIGSSSIQMGKLPRQPAHVSVTRYQTHTWNRCNPLSRIGGTPGVRVSRKKASFLVKVSFALLRKKALSLAHEA